MAVPSAYEGPKLGSKNCDNQCGDVVFGQDQLNIVTDRKIGVQLFFGTPIAVLLTHQFGAATGGTPSVVWYFRHSDLNPK